MYVWRELTNDSVQEWSDYRLTWDSSEFDGISTALLSPTSMWTPDCYLVNKYNAIEGLFQSFAILSL